MNLDEQIHKIKKLSGLKESAILTEKLSNVDDDVDMLYNQYFKDDLVKAITTGEIRPPMFSRYTTDTSILKNELCCKAHALNPCQIFINYDRNFYQPKNNRISISVSNAAVSLVWDNGGSIKKAAEELPAKDLYRFNNEFTEARVKGSIHHELVHWLDDSLNNKHITKFLAKKDAQAGEAQNNAKEVNVHPLEIQAQIHNIKQVYNQNKNVWDQLSFEELVRNMPALSFITRLPEDLKTKWVRDIKTRMHREGLLGKNMVN